MPVRVGILGTGFAARRHADALRRLPWVELASVAGSDRERSEAVARELGAAGSHPHPEALLEDPTIDSIHICGVNATHAALARTALQAGKHVLCEKPLGTSSPDTRELATLAEEVARDGVISGVCFNYRHYPLVQHLRRAVCRGDFGPVHLIHGGYLQDWLLYEDDWSWRLDEMASGPSRAVADIGSHWIDLVQHLLDSSVVAVMADLGTLHPERRRPAGPGQDDAVSIPTEDFASVLLRFDDGAHGSFVVSQTSAGSKNRLSFQIDCAEAALAWDQEQPERAWIGRRGAPNLELLRDPEQLDVPASAAPRLPAGHPEGWSDALANLMCDFYGAVRAAREDREDREHEPSFATFADGDRIVRLVEAIVDSHQRQAWVQVPQPAAVRS